VSHNSTPAGAFAAPGERARWAALLAAIYLAAAAAGWQRTLIEDEIWGLYQTERPLLRMLAHVAGDLVHPPLWYVIEKIWLGLVGRTDAAAKTLAMLVNVPTLFLFTALAARVTPHWRLAALLFAGLYFRIGAPPHLARMYGLLLLLAVAAMLLWERWRERPTRGRLLAWAAVMFCAVHTHYLGVLLLLGFVVANWRQGPQPRQFLYAACVVLLLLVPWIGVSLPVYFERGLGPNLAWVEPDALRTLRQLPFYFMSYIPSGGDPYLEARRWLAGEYWVAMMVAAGAIHLLLVVFARRRLRELWPPAQEDAPRRWFWLATLLVLVPVALMYGFSVAVHPAMDARFLLGVLPAYWLAVVLLGERGGRAGRVLLHAVVLPWVLASAIVTLPDARPSPARTGAERAAAEWRPGDLLLADCRAGVQVWWEWTRRLGRAERLEVAGCEHRRWWVPELVARAPVEINLAGVERVWFLYAEEGERQRVAEVLAARGFALHQASVQLEFGLVLVRGEPGN
jgi:hypothetical protein